MSSEQIIVRDEVALGDRIVVVDDSTDGLTTRQELTVRSVGRFADDEYRYYYGPELYEHVPAWPDCKVVLLDRPKPKFDPKRGEVYRANRITYIILDDGLLARHPDEDDWRRFTWEFKNPSAEKVFDPAEEHEALPLPEREIQVGDRVRYHCEEKDWGRTDVFTVAKVNEYTVESSAGHFYNKGRVELVDPEPPTLPVGAIVETTNAYGQAHIDVILPDDRARCLELGETCPAVGIVGDVIDGRSRIVWLPES